MWQRPFCIPAFPRLRLLQFPTKCGLQFHNTSLWWSSCFTCDGVGLIKIEDNFIKDIQFFDTYSFMTHELFTTFVTKIELKTFKKNCYHSSFIFILFSTLSENWVVNNLKSTRTPLIIVTDNCSTRLKCLLVYKAMRIVSLMPHHMNSYFELKPLTF